MRTLALFLVLLLSIGDFQRQGYGRVWSFKAPLRYGL